MGCSWSYGGYLGALALTKAATTHGIKLKAVVAGRSTVTFCLSWRLLVFDWGCYLTNGLA